MKEINMNQLGEIVVVKPKRKKSIMGSMDVKKLVYRDLTEKVKNLDYKNLTEEDEQLIERYKDVGNMDIKVKSFLPEEYIKELKTIKNKVTGLYQGHCLSDSCSYMTVEKWEDFKKEIEPYVEQCRCLITRIVDNWDNVFEYAIELLYNVLEEKISKDELREIIKRRMPKPSKFEKSYENSFCYTVTPLVNELKYVNIMTGGNQCGEDFYISEIEEITKEALTEVVKTLDNMLNKQQLAKLDFHKEKKLQLRPRRRLKACSESIQRVTVAFKDNKLIDLSRRIDDILEETNDFILYEEAELICYDIITKMYESKLLDKDEYISDLSYITKEKFDNFYKYEI